LLDILSAQGYRRVKDPTHANNIWEKESHTLYIPVHILQNTVNFDFIISVIKTDTSKFISDWLIKVVITRKLSTLERISNSSLTFGS
jgi:hypothetical protein